jgi:putative methionine-R-sulfoxide reductase with GAF domain
MRHGEVCAVLDIDSRELNTFDNTDKHYLQKVAQMLAK